MDEHERAEAEDIIRAIRHGEVDAFVVREASEERIYSLRSADVLYRAMIEEMKDGAVALDASGLIVYCNAYFAQLMKVRSPGADRDEDRSRSRPGTIAGSSPALGQQFETGAARRELELALQASDGTMVPVAGGDEPHRARRRHRGVLPDRHRPDADRRDRDELLIEGRRKDEFLAMLAHELRNPIAPIRYAAERLRASEPTPARLQWARDVIERQVEQLTRLVDDLLDVSRISARQGQPRPASRWRSMRSCRAPSRRPAR